MKLILFSYMYVKTASLALDCQFVWTLANKVMYKVFCRSQYTLSLFPADPRIGSA